MADAYHAYRAGDLDGSTRLSSSTTPRSSAGLVRRELAVDTRLRDRLRAPRFGEAGIPSVPRLAASRESRTPPRSRPSTRRSGRPTSASRPRSRESTPLEPRAAAARRIRAARRDTTPGIACSAFVPTRRAAVVALRDRVRRVLDRVLGWPMAKGRDTWDYLAYYLQLFDSDPRCRSSSSSALRSLRSSSAFRWTSAASGSSTSCSPLLYAISIVAWSATALAFGRIPALFSALLLLVYPAFATLYHQASSDAVFATGLALWALLLARALDPPSTWRLRRARRGPCGARAHSPREPGPAPARGRSRRFSRPSRGGGGSSGRRLRRGSRSPARGLGASQRRALRRRDRRAGRPRVGPVPAASSRETGRSHPRTARPPSASASSSRSEVLRRSRTRASTCRSTRTCANGSNYETVRLIALSDRVLGRDENYDVLFDSRSRRSASTRRRTSAASPTRSGSSCAQKPLREDVAPREQTAPEAPAPTFETRRRRASEPAGDGPRRRRPVRVRLVRVRLHRLVHARRSVAGLERSARQERYREVVAQVRAWDAELPTRRASSLVPEILNRITPRFPRPSLWLAVGVGRARLAAAARARARSSCSGFGVPRPPHPRRVAGRRAGVRAAAVPGVHRHRARCARGGSRPTPDRAERSPLASAA